MRISHKLPRHIKEALLNIPRDNRGATLVEYAFVILTIFVTSLLGSMYFQQSAQAHYKQTSGAGPFAHDEKPLLATINADWAK